MKNNGRKGSRKKKEIMKRRKGISMAARGQGRKGRDGRVQGQKGMEGARERRREIGQEGAREGREVSGRKRREGMGQGQNDRARDGSKGPKWKVRE